MHMSQKFSDHDPVAAPRFRVGLSRIEVGTRTPILNGETLVIYDGTEIT